ASTDLCMPSSGAVAAYAYPDGPNGLDNAFGKNLLPLFLQSIPDLSFEANRAITNGDFTILIRIAKLGAGADQGSLLSKGYTGAITDDIPKFDGTDCWTIAPESLTDVHDIESASLVFPMSSLANNYYDSGTGGDLPLTLKVLDFEGRAVIHRARIT